MGTDCCPNTADGNIADATPSFRNDRRSTCYLPSGSDELKADHPSITAPESVLEGPVDVRFGSLADRTPLALNVRFTPNSGHRAVSPRCPLSANGRHLTVPTSMALTCRWGVVPSIKSRHHVTAWTGMERTPRTRSISSVGITGSSSPRHATCWSGRTSTSLRA